MQRMSGLSATKINAAALYFNFVVLALLGLAINPLLVSYLGAASFGLWKSCFRILDFATIADGRATQALKWVVAYRVGELETDIKQREVGASLVVWLTWLPILVTIVGALAYALPFIITGVSISDFAVVRLVGAILGANVILTALLGIPDAVLVGTNQGYRSTYITTFFLIVSNAAMIATAWAGLGLPALAIVVLANSVLNGICTWLVARRRVYWWGIRKPEWNDVRKLAGFSSWTLLGALMQMLFVSTELLLFSVLLGAVAVTNYTFTSYVLQFALSICLMTASAVTPRLGSLIGGKNAEEARVLIAHTREVVLAIASVAGSAILLLNRGFVANWAGSAYYLGDQVNALMVAAFLQLALIRCDGQIQDVCLQIGQKVIVGILGCILGALLAWFMYRMTGNLVAMYSGLLAGRMVLTVLFPRFVADMAGEAKYSVRGIGMTAIIMFICYLVGPYLKVDGWAELIVTAVASVSVLSLWAYVAILSAETRTKIIQTLFGRPA